MRRLENLLQAINDEQTQTLPTVELNQARLAWGMGFGDWPELMAQLDQHMRSVRLIFNELIGDDEGNEGGETASSEQFAALWQDSLDESDLDPLLRS